MMSTLTKPLLLYSAATPNGQQAFIILEELKAVYSAVDYDFEKINIPQRQQKEPWFLKINPNGRIPALVDRSHGNFPVFESAAISLYLAQKYDSEYKFWFNPTTSPNEYNEMLQWIFFAHGGLGPMMGQSEHFNHLDPAVPYARNRYINETKRLYGVLESRLQDRDFLVGEGRGKYSLADIKAFPWARLNVHAGVETLDEWPSVKSWVERCVSRPGAQSGLSAPGALYT